MFIIIIIRATSGAGSKPASLANRSNFTYHGLRGRTRSPPRDKVLVGAVAWRKTLSCPSLGSETASCLFHGLTLDHCQDFQENRKWICGFYEAKALSGFPGLVCHMEMSCFIALLPLIYLPRLWGSALLFPHVTTWWGLSAVFTFFVAGDDVLILGFASISKHCVVTLP